MSEGPDTDAGQPRAGRCALVGRVNVGKSTLMNALLGQKLAIATDRPGTTRSHLLGLYYTENPPTQIALIDTPGLTARKSALSRVLEDESRIALADADVVLMVTDVAGARGETPGVAAADEAVLRSISHHPAPRLLAINKIDRLKDRTRLFAMIEAYNEACDFAATIPISALHAQNLDGILKEIRPHLGEGLLYDPEFLTDRPERFFYAELVREAVISHTSQEVPHGIAVLIDQVVQDGGLLRIDATVVVEKASHKGIVIGAGGQRLKSIGTQARKGIEALAGGKVFLKLWVKVVKDWTGRADQAHRFVKEPTP